VYGRNGVCLVSSSEIPRCEVIREARGHIPDLSRTHDENGERRRCRRDDVDASEHPEDLTSRRGGRWWKIVMMAGDGRERGGARARRRREAGSDSEN